METQILTDEQFNSPENQNRDKSIIGYRSIENGTKPLNIARVSNCYTADCLIQDSCKSFKTERCNKECKLYA